MPDMDYTPGEDAGIEEKRVGKHLAYIADSEIVKSKAGDNMLRLRWELRSRGFEGDAEWQNLNLWNRSDQAKRMAQRMMNQICKALGVTARIKDSALLHDKPCFIHIRRQKNNQEFTEIWKVEASGPAGAASTESAIPGPSDAPGGADDGAVPDYDDDIPF